jgi:hypothetical protein
MRQKGWLATTRKQIGELEGLRKSWKDDGLRTRLRTQSGWVDNTKEFYDHLDAAIEALKRMVDIGEAGSAEFSRPPRSDK